MNVKTMNGQAHAPQIKRPPSDLELMLYFDGELTGSRLAEVRQAIERDKTLQKKLAALQLSAEVVEENAMAIAQVDLANAIMSKVAAEDIRSLDPRDAAPLATNERMAEVKPLLGKTLVHAKANPSNDNARGVFSLAALAVAAAAGLMIWGRLDTAGPRLDGITVAMTTVAATPAEASLPTAAPAQTPAMPSAEPEGEDEVGVEVAAVDFGSRTGTIFYVPTEAATSNHTTTVVWLSDDSAGGEQ